jgi:glycosyltransferase involved in cell wall biosynthesis
MVPEIKKKVPKIRILILGGGPILESPSEEVLYTGFVEDLPTYLNLADICVAPFPAEAVCGGTRNKVCEYLACGKPIVATREGMRGFDDAIPGAHYLLAEDASDFVQKIVDCIHHPGKARQIGQNARALSEHYDWEHLAKQLQGVFQQVAEERP